MALQDGNRVVRLKRRAGPNDPTEGVVIASAPLTATPNRPLELRIQARGERYDVAYAERPGVWTTLQADLDGSILSTRTAGGFVGAVFGLYAYSAPE